MTKAEPIKVFQLKHNLMPDGKIGAKTCEKMREVWNLSKEELAHFLGQGHIESGEWSLMRENMNYSWNRLMIVFKSYFTITKAKDFQNQPERIANYVYDDKNRGKNSKLGNIEIGDGWKYRATAIGITGRDNITRFSKFVNDLSIIENPDLVWQNYYFESFLFFFNDNKIWNKCQFVNDYCFKRVTLSVNGGYNHLKERSEKTKYYYNLQK